MTTISKLTPEQRERLAHLLDNDEEYQRLRQLRKAANAKIQELARPLWDAKDERQHIQYMADLRVRYLANEVRRGAAIEQ